MKTRFDLKIGIEILVDNEIWLQRISEAQRTRPQREDNSIKRIQNRKELHQKEIKKIKKLFDEWYIIDNSRDFSETQFKFYSLMGDLL